MPRGYLLLVLHTHLPFVRHPEDDDFLEEDWLYEAILETYLPLIEVFERLENDGVDWRMTISLTPPLVSMFADPLLQDRARRHIERMVELAEKEVRRTENQSAFNSIARMYLENFKRARTIFVDHYGSNLVNGFKRFQDSGKLEIITCAATHGFLPLMEIHPAAVRAQIKVAVESYKRHFGRPPRGIWLPECGYQPGHDWILQENGLKFFFLETHGLLFANPRPRYGVYAPVFCRSGVAAFGRDMESSKQVWSSIDGYPGDFCYRDFYRDIGFDLDFDYVRPYIHHNGTRIFTGIKYYRITGKTNDKHLYDPWAGKEKAAMHAGNFMFNRQQQINYVAGGMDRQPVIVAPYDAELFGHWWYEGPQWLEFLFRKMHFDQDEIKMITPSEYLALYPRNQVCTPSMSSWGWKGYSEVWLEGSNDWIYRHLHQAEERMIELARNYPHSDGLLQRALNQAARELLLAQSSDWAFIMKTGTHVPYAVKRTKNHILRFTRLYREIRNNSITQDFLSGIEGKDNIFPEIDYRIYAS